MSAPETTSPESRADQPRPSLTWQHVAIAVGSCLVLILPVRAAFDQRTYGGLYLWLFVIVVVAGLIAFGAYRTRIANGATVAVGTFGIFALTQPLLLWLVSRLDDPGTDGEVALMTGITGAGLAVLVVAVVLPVFIEILRPVCFGLAAVGLIAGVVFGEPAWSQVEDTRRVADKIATLEATDLDPYLATIEGFTASYQSSRSRPNDAGPAAYTIRYSPRPGDYDVSTVDIEYALDDGTIADPCELYDCEERDGYTVVTSDGTLDSVTAQPGHTLMRATFDQGTTKLPSVDEVGQAMVDAELVDWADVVHD